MPSLWDSPVNVLFFYNISTDMSSLWDLGFNKKSQRDDISVENQMTKQYIYGRVPEGWHIKNHSIA